MTAVDNMLNEPSLQHVITDQETNISTWQLHTRSCDLIDIQVMSLLSQVMDQFHKNYSGHGQIIQAQAAIAEWFYRRYKEEKALTD